MVHEEGLEEPLIGALNVALTAASQLGEFLARIHAQRLRVLETATRGQAREARTRFDAERAAAAAELSQANRPDWWDRTGPDGIGRTYATAIAWRDYAPEAAAAEERMRTELRQRYGIDVDALSADPAAVQAKLRQYEAERSGAGQERQGEKEDRAEAARLNAEATRAGLDAEQAQAGAATDPKSDGGAAAAAVVARDAETTNRGLEGAAYDSAERRAETAAAMEANGVPPKLVQVRMLADVSQAAPPADAVRTRTDATARKGRTMLGKGREQQLGR
ncbi:hypothetical protein [Sinomonas terrae]|uniref:Uncharacterized protein n=1 Tax=Sinomonas terrae TaxID=2908838 RepID=A0ABS9U732_9MICC|nr:hypothetical protein [Sinomonas terrae]MCH6472410.1 hypothetical protein [Sinomonas terrae]